MSPSRAGSPVSRRAGSDARESLARPPPHLRQPLPNERRRTPDPTKTARALRSEDDEYLRAPVVGSCGGGDEEDERYQSYGVSVLTEPP